MDEIDDNPQLARLMAEMSWLRRLARALLRGADGAEDLVQDTWVTAAARPPADAGSLRPWLGRVALNLVRGRGRADKRRVAREQALGELADPVRTPEELVRRLELQRLVADAVVRLAEPYRSTILLHYFEELSSAEIARHAIVFNSWMKLPSTVTDQDGAFKIAGLTSGSYALWARAPDGGEGTVAGIAAGASAVAIRIERPGAIEGKLVGFPTAPLVYATMLETGAIHVEASRVTPSSFRIGGLRPGRYVVNAQTRYEGEAQLVEVKRGVTRSLVLTARGRGTIEGTVLDFRTRAPIAGAACHVFASADGIHGVTSWDSRTAPRSDAQGRVLLDPAPAGPVAVGCVMPSTRRSLPSAEVVLSPGGRAAVQLLSAEMLLDYPSTIGIGFDWRVTQPRIAEVRAEGPAAKAGLLAGDLVVGVDGASMAGLNGEGVLHIIDGRAARTEVSVTVARGAQRKTFTMKAEPRRL